jgi:hypothetical protein
LIQAGLIVVKEKPMPIIYKEVKLDHGIEWICYSENRVVIELKRFTDVHTAQVLT